MNDKKFPWNQIKIVFPFDGSSSELWNNLEKAKQKLPNGWELIETQSNPAFDTFAIFDVSVMPLIKDGKIITKILKNLKKKSK